MGDERRGVTARVRCTACGVTELVEIPRWGNVVLVPERLVHVQCGKPVKILSKELRKFLEGEGGM